MHGKIRRSSTEATKAGAWRDQLWAGDHFERDEESVCERERERG